MKHPIAKIYLATLIALAVPAACSETTTIPPALSPKVFVCQYHVIEKFVDGNEQLIERVLAQTRGEPQVEELVQVLLELGKDSPEIITAGDELWKCIPKKVVAPIPDAGNKVL